MINVVLDTCIFRNDPNRIKAPFRVFSRLASENKLKLYILDLVKKEFVSQRFDEYESAVKNVKNALKALNRKFLPDEIKVKISQIIDEFSKVENNIKTYPEFEFVTWLSSIHAEKVSIDANLAPVVLRSYFEGQKPFKNKKSRDYFPDAFIFESIKRLSMNFETLHVVVNDGNLKQAINSIENVTTYSTLNDFIDSQEVRNVLDRLEATNEIFRQIIVKLEGNVDDLDMIVKNQATDKLVGETIHDERIPDDNNEAIINGIYQPEDVEHLFGEAILVGDEIILIPFKFVTTVNTYYYIYKPDYYIFEEDENRRIGISDHNDHYFEAEEDFNVEVTGDLSIQINRDNIDGDIEDVWELIRYENCGIDKISKIAILDDP